MKKYLISAALFIGFLLSPVLIHQVEAADLTGIQISAILGLLQAFNANPSVIANVQAALGGGGSGTINPTGDNSFPTATLTINGQTVVSDADSANARIWAWSSSPAGATVSASVIRSGCDSASQNGTTNPWNPWVANDASGSVTGTSAGGSNTAVLGAAYSGCTITGTYTVMNSGQIATARASITLRHGAGAGTGTTAGTDLCGQQGLTNAAGEMPANPTIGGSTPITKPTDVIAGGTLGRYHLGSNEALVFPVTVGDFSANPSAAYGTVSTVYEGSNYIISFSKNKCDFSQPLETTGCLAMTGASASEGGMSWSSMPSSNPNYSAVRCHVPPGQYYISMRNARTDPASNNGTGMFRPTRPFQDYCQLDAHGVGCDFSGQYFPTPDFTPFGSASVGAFSQPPKTTNFTVSSGEFAGFYATVDALCAKVTPRLAGWGLGGHGVFLNGEPICAPGEVGPPYPIDSTDYKGTGTCSNGGSNYPICTAPPVINGLTCDTSKTRADASRQFGGASPLNQIQPGQVVALSFVAPSLPTYDIRIYGGLAQTYASKRGTSLSLSTKPCDFSDAVPALCKATGNGEEVINYLMVGNTTQYAGRLCTLTPGATYYQNIKTNDGQADTYWID